MRLHLTFGTITALLLLLTVGYTRKPNLDFAQVERRAAALALAPYEAPRSPLNDELKNLNYDQARDIRWRDEFTLFRDRALPFQAKFFHLGRAHQHPVELAIVSDAGIARLQYSPRFFDFGKNVFKSPLPENLGYAGFRLHYPLNKPDYLDEVAVFLGASYFRAVAREQWYGLSARGLAINTAVPKTPEEFPSFTHFWLHEPEANATSFKLNALLEGASVTGAYEFVITPGDETTMDVRAHLFFRKDVRRVGIAPLTSMFWYGENTGRPEHEFRPEVHDSDGLLMHNGRSEWLWRPLSSSPRIEENVFADENPRGFGLMQRDREFPHYQDLEAKYHLRPSLFVTPVGDWGKGSVVLVQIPTRDEFLDNIVAFWTPAKPVKAGDQLQFRYGLRWLMNHAELPPLGYCVQTLVGQANGGPAARFVLDFRGGPLAASQPEFLPTAEIHSEPAGLVRESQVQWNDYEKTWRVSFVVEPPAKEKKRPPPVELRCRVIGWGKPVTETWTYTWNP